MLSLPSLPVVMPIAASEACALPALATRSVAPRTIAVLMPFSIQSPSMGPPVLVAESYLPSALNWLCMSL